jgi:hypothetical protein
MLRRCPPRPFGQALATDALTPYGKGELRRAGRRCSDAVMGMMRGGILSKTKSGRIVVLVSVYLFAGLSLLVLRLSA